MSQQRMAGGPEFKEGLQKASQPKGQETDNYKTQGSHLIGGGAYDRQVDRETRDYNNSAITGSQGAANLTAYANASKAATASNNTFSQDKAKGWSSTARDESNTNKQQEANSNFSGQRIQNNVNYANDNRQNNISNNQGFSMGVTQDFTENAKNSREDNSTKATNFADRTVDKYLQKNKDNQAIDIAALDKIVRQAPLIDEAKSKVQGNNTFGDMYSYSKKGLPSWKSPKSPSKIEQPDFKGMYDKTTKDIKDISIK